MADQIRDIYRVQGAQDRGLELQLNMLLSRLSERLDRIEGLRGNPRFYKTVFDLINGNMTAGQVLRATAADRAEISTLDVTEVDGATPAIDSGLPANIDLSQSLISITDQENDAVIHQFPAQWLEYNAEVFGFLTHEGITPYNDPNDIGDTLVSITDLENGEIVHQFPGRWLAYSSEVFGFLTHEEIIPDENNAIAISDLEVQIAMDRGEDPTILQRLKLLEDHRPIAIGGIYKTLATYADSAEVNAVLGYGTWAAWGTGRVSVGLDAADADFDTVGETGGAKTHQHTVDVPDTQSDGPSQGVEIAAGAGATVADMLHHHHTDPAEFNSGSASSMPPYIVCYYWRRTA